MGSLLLGCGVWSTGKITNEVVQEYHNDKPNSVKGNLILE